LEHVTTALNVARAKPERPYNGPFNFSISTTSGLVHWNDNLLNNAGLSIPRKRPRCGWEGANDNKTGIIFRGPPCASGKSAKLCSIRKIPDEPLFRGRFDVYGHINRFEGSIVSTAANDVSV